MCVYKPIPFAPSGVLDSYLVSQLIILDMKA